MGFKSVYRCLQEVFPEMDARILKAVAIEHSKDADAAVNDILTEVLPYMTSTSKKGECGDNGTLLWPRPEVEVATAVPSELRSIVADRLKDSAYINGVFHGDTTHLNEGDDVGPSSGLKCAAVENVENSDCINGDLQADFTHLDEVVNAGSSSEQSSGCEIVKNNGSANGSFRADTGLTHWHDAVNGSEISGSDTANDGDSQLLRSIINEGLPQKHGETCGRENGLDFGENADVLSTDSEKKGTDDQDHINTELNISVSCDKINGIVDGEQASFSASPSSINRKDDFDLLSQERDCEVDECIDGKLFDRRHFVAERVRLPVQLQMAEATTCDLQSEFRGDPLAAFEELRQSACFTEEVYAVGETGSIDDDFTRHSTLAQSGQISSTDFLDEIIEDAKNNKKTLFSAMESVMNLMKEVELHERAAECAKEEAAVGGLDILVKAEELKQMLAHAKEANDMHAGEVYGEKAILATEVGELQARLFCLSDERDKSLATLDEMRQTLEERLAAAEEMKKAAEQEKLEKEESALKVLAEQEAIMEKVVQESKLLEQEAEHNSKLREFLVDRGTMVDTLQGEISVICQDVSLLKEKFDNRVPLSMSVSSSQTTCKLASSGSSLKSMSSVIAPEEKESPKNPEMVSPDSSISDLMPKIGNKKDRLKSDDKDLLEDGWDIFDKDAELDI